MELDWPTLIEGTPYTGMAEQTLGDWVEGSAQNVHLAYREALLEDRLPFLALRSSFQKPQFLAQVYTQMQADDAQDRIVGDDGQVLHPNYRLVDPGTFFALLKIALTTAE